MEEKIAAIMSLMLGKNIGVGDKVEMQSEPAWDSMKHIELIMTLEQELGVSFEPEDIPLLKSMALIVDKTRSLAGE